MSVIHFYIPSALSSDGMSDIGRKERVTEMGHERLTTYFALGVGTIWAVVTLISLYIDDYTALTAITPVMLIVTGFLFGYRGGKNGQQK